jgi:hypothetical protein
MTSPRDQEPRGYLALPRAWLPLEESTLAALLTDHDHLWTDSVVMAALTTARDSRLKGLNVYRLMAMLTKNETRIRQDLHRLCSLDLVSFQTRRTKANPQTRWYRLTPTGQRITERALSSGGAFKLPYARLALITKPKAQTIWIEAVRASHPSKTATEVAHMLSLKPHTVRSHYRLHAVSDAAPVSQFGPDVCFLTAADEEALEAARTTIRLYGPGTIAVVVNGQSEGTVKSHPDFYSEIKTTRGLILKAA